VKAGDLVRKRKRPGIYRHFGLVVKARIDASTGMQAVRVHYFGDYGTFWTSSRSLEVVSEGR